MSLVLRNLFKMKYTYKILTIDSYLETLYKDGFNKSSKFDNDELENLISTIGIFKFKGYVKAFRQDVSNFSIDDVINLYNADRSISSKMFELSSSIEIKLKAYLESYDFDLNKEEYLSNKKLIKLNEKLDINYPPFHYFVENITLGALLKMISKLNINNQSILKLLANKFNMYDGQVFLNYLYRLKELRNRCAHNGRLFNRNYRGIKAYGIHKKFRKTIYEHKLVDVYYSLCLLIADTKDIKIVDDLIEKFKNNILISCDNNLKEFVINIMKTRQVCMQGLTVSGGLYTIVDKKEIK